MRTGCSTAGEPQPSVRWHRRVAAAAGLACARRGRHSEGPPAPRARARDLGIEIGTLPPGPTNSIVDVANVSVGHATVWFDEPPPPAGRGVARTGVTAIVPFTPGELFEARPGRRGGAQRRRRAHRLPPGPGVGVARDAGPADPDDGRRAGLRRRRRRDARGGPGSRLEDVVIPTVGECDDSWLSDGRAVQVEAADVARAIAAARGARRRAGRRRRGRRRHRHGVPRVQGRHRLGVAGGAADGLPARRARARELRRRRRADRRRGAGRSRVRRRGMEGRARSAGGELHRRARDRRAAVVAPARTAGHAPGSDSRAPARSRTTAAARSSSRSAPARGCPGPRTRTSSIATCCATRRSTRSSPPRSKRPRRPSSTAWSPPTPSPAGTATSPPASRSTASPRSCAATAASTPRP